jgi:uncharacterized protein DUF1552
MAVSRRSFLKGVSLGGMAVRIGLPPLAAMFNSSGTAYAGKNGVSAIESRFVLWFNGNGIVENYWVPREVGANYDLTPCLKPLEPFKKDIHVITGLDNPNGKGHHGAMSSLMSGQAFTGRGAGGPSIDQVIAQKIGNDSRFRSLQIGACQESFGESIQRNMSWSERDRPLPPEMIPHRLFDRLFGGKDMGWIKSVLDRVREDASSFNARLGQEDKTRLDEYLTSVRSVERTIASLPPEYALELERPEESGDMRDWPRIAKLQSDLLVHALASRQTRVASYMLTKCQSLTRFPWLGHTTNQHHGYTHQGAATPEGQRIMRDINRWHVEEFAYLLAKLKSIPEGDGNLLDNTLLVYVHEHAEANSHKTSGMSAILAGHAGKLKTGLHSNVTGTVGDLYLTLADEVMGAQAGKFPTASGKLSDLV